MWTLTSLARYQITPYETEALLAANILLARFNSAGHFFKAWNKSYIRAKKSRCGLNLRILFLYSGNYALNGINNNFWLGDSWNEL